MNKAGTQIIETDRLILRRFRVEDAADMHMEMIMIKELTV